MCNMSFCSILEKQVSNTPKEGTKVNILIADDHQEIRSALRLLLEQETQLTIAGEAVEAMDLVLKVHQLQPDIVLLDWELPGLDKISSIVRPEKHICSVLRAHCPSLKIVALSGRPDARNEALAAGADSFISKSNPPEQLLAVICALGLSDSGHGHLERG